VELKLVLNSTEIQTSYTDITLQHRGRSIVWSFSAFKKNQGKDVAITRNLFDDINSYWAQLPESKQDQIFSVYIRIKEIFESTENTKSLTSSLIPLLSELYELHPLEDMDHWLRFYSDIRIPEKIDKIEEFVQSDDISFTRQKTYTREDYLKLLVLALALRVVVPVWGELINFTEKQKIWGTHWKEYRAYQLLARTPLTQCEAMTKLRGSVNAYIPPDKSKRPHSAILAGVGSEDYPEWLLGVIVFRRVCVGDLRSHNPDSHLVSSICSYIGNRLTPSESSFIGHVREKNNREGEDQENKISYLEGFKIRQKLSEGDIAIIVRSARDYKAVAQKVSPTTPLELVDLIHAAVVPVLANERIQKPQLTLMQLVLDRAIKPRSLQSLPRKSFLDNLAVATAVLIHKGHYDLAGILSAKTIASGAEGIETLPFGRSKIPDNLLTQLAQYYPNEYRSIGKQNREGGKTQNAAVSSIDMFTKELANFGWTLTLPSEWVARINPDQISRRFNIPRDIRTKLALLAIDIVTRSL
jgi:hypothetical protein